MIRLIKGGEPLPKREEAVIQNVEAAVRNIIADVRARGDEALLEYGKRFDCAELNALQVTEAEIEEACAKISPEVMSALNKAAENIRAFHSMQKREGFRIQKGDVILGQRITPVDRAGIYVPGGTACYPSTVLMDAIPASIAGVSEIIMATPAGKDGTILPEVLAAAKLAGVTKIFKMGGAQAIAALAYGTESVPRVDKIVGPGNIYVATAKRMVFGQVGIDMVAGPSEILIVADSSAKAKVVAADMLSQAEHDVMASSILVTTDMALAEAVQAELEVQIPQLPRRDICRRSIDENSFIVVVDSIEKAIEISNSIAPEHLELCVEDPFALLDLVKHAGSIFMGNNAPEALGDYLAGPNHTLPTSGTARFSSPLSVDDFIKKSSFTYYTYEALGEVKDAIAALANKEGLQAHAKSATIRFEEVE
ncbi:MAG: histidinol dehydrogenase [Clostridia bacterium]|nr:histidinol dehydrogenase [Clostridia bacterium]MBR3865522.1 histidinol dehydrogenase [Clostridia bacterium]